MVKVSIQRGIVSQEALESGDTIVYEIAKDEVRELDFLRVDQLLDDLGRQGANGIGRCVLSFPYDDDPREIYQIDEIRTYMRALVKRCPWVFAVLPAEQEIITPLWLCLVDTVVHKSGGSAQVALTDMRAAMATLLSIADAAVVHAGEANRDDYAAAMVKVVKGITGR